MDAALPLPQGGKKVKPDVLYTNLGSKKRGQALFFHTF
jgi:hypothetical protein